MSEREPELSPESEAIVWYSFAAFLAAVTLLALLLWGGLLCPVTFLFLAIACLIFPAIVIIAVIVHDAGLASVFL